MKTYSIFRFNFILYSIFVLTLFSCQHDLVPDETAEDEPTEITANSVEGIVRVKLNEEKTTSLSVSLKSAKLSSNISSLDTILNSIGAISFKRTFPYSGKYEARTKALGMHLWYDITYDTTAISLNNAIGKFENLSEIDITEPIQKIKNKGAVIKKRGPIPFSTTLKSKAATTSYPFNDAFLSRQWNFYNDGTVTDAISGCDINLFDAWLKQTGSEKVIVAVIDGGIDIDHEDLVNNVWVNNGENAGSSNTDDDNNGYKDDLNGYNFVESSGTIVAEDHGTHVAGIIGAENGNGIGVCGIAGGNADHAGVRLMSCQVFETDANGDEISAGNFAEAIKYAADNGAVICQNSWGYDNVSYLPNSMKEAIDYFIQYAGIDETGAQVGPMNGGVVIFAAGNESVSTNSYPAMYSEVVSVASTGADYIMSYYSNFGSWIDITAPGGTDTDDTYYDNYIGSTVTDNEYAYMIGTSMACPHVSGVAALIVSEYGGDGFTPEMLKARLYRGAVDLDDYNPTYAGKMGSGLINAAAALADYNRTPPEAVTDLTAGVVSNKASLTWTITEDADDVKPTGYKIYYSTSPVSEDDIKTNSASLSTSTALVGLSGVGESMTTTIENLNYTTTYYFAVAGYDILGSYADISNVVSLTTEPNHSPVITSDENSFNLLSHETVTFTVNISEPDGDSYTWNYTDKNGGSSAEENSSEIAVTINALSVDPGTYEAAFTAEDQYGAAADYTIRYTVQENHSPVVFEAIENIYIGNLNTSYTLNLQEYFRDEDGEDLEYSLNYSSSYLNASLSDETVTIVPQSNGLSSFTITASDARGETASTTFQVMVRNNDQAIEIYPNPVSDVVYFRMGEDIDGDLEIEIYNDSGVKVKDITTPVSTFSPASTNLSDLASGQYLLKITYNNQEFERNIVKL